MRLVRLLLMIVFSLLAAAIVYTTIRSTNQDVAASVGLLTIVALIILILGPLWPSPEKIARWTQRWKFTLPTDDQRVAKYVLYVVTMVFGLYRAWGFFHYPPEAMGVWRFEKPVLAAAGTNGVILFWLFLAAACLLAAVGAYRKTKRR